MRTLVQREMAAALGRHDVLISPVAPTTAYRLGSVAEDPLEMYKGDLMTVNLNLAGAGAVFLYRSMPVYKKPCAACREACSLLRGCVRF